MSREMLKSSRNFRAENTPNVSDNSVSDLTKVISGGFEQLRDLLTKSQKQGFKLGPAELEPEASAAFVKKKLQKSKDSTLSGEATEKGQINIILSVVKPGCLYIDVMIGRKTSKFLLTRVLLLQ